MLTLWCCCGISAQFTPPWTLVASAKESKQTRPLLVLRVCTTHLATGDDFSVQYFWARGVCAECSDDACVDDAGSEARARVITSQRIPAHLSAAKDKVQTAMVNLNGRLRHRIFLFVLVIAYPVCKRRFPTDCAVRSVIGYIDHTIHHSDIQL
jgi:hypothetical protein